MTGQRRRREFPEAFRREAVGRVRTSGLTIIAVAKELDVHETPRTALDHAADGEPGAVPTQRSGATAAAGGLSPADLAAENARLKRELQRAQMERDILKKAAAAIVARSCQRLRHRFEHRWRRRNNGLLFGATTR